MKYCLSWLAAVCTAILLVCPAPLTAATQNSYTEKLPYEGSIDVSWETTGIASVDVQSETFAKDLVTEFKERAGEMNENLDKEDFRPVPCSLTVRAEVKGTPGTVAIIWSMYEYLGGAHGTLGLSSQLYDAKTGRTVENTELFELPDVAEDVFSKVAQRELLARGFPKEMVEAGTTTGEGNFMIMVPDAEGVTLFFDPYQVAPWSEGVPEVHVGLKELAEAHPVMHFWGKK